MCWISKGVRRNLLTKHEITVTSGGEMVSFYKDTENHKRREIKQMEKVREWNIIFSAYPGGRKVLCFCSRRDLHTKRTPWSASTAHAWYPTKAIHFALTTDMAVNFQGRRQERRRKGQLMNQKRQLWKHLEKQKLCSVIKGKPKPENNI